MMDARVTNTAKAGGGCRTLTKRRCRRVRGTRPGDGTVVRNRGEALHAFVGSNAMSESAEFFHVQTGMNCRP